MIIGTCIHCKKEKKITIKKRHCRNCQRRYFLRIPLKECKKCKQMKPHHAKGFCRRCYNHLRLDHIRGYNYERYHNISAELYRKITQKCIICDFNKVIQLHHVDNNHNNNSVDNMVGLCPTHHKMIHTIEDGEFLQEVVERLMTFERLKKKYIIVTEEIPLHELALPNNLSKIPVALPNIVKNLDY